MDALELLHELEAVGITVAAAGDMLRVRPASRLTEPYRVALRAAKPEVLALLIDREAAEADLEMFEERAAIAEFDGGLSRADAEVAAREMLRALARARSGRH